MKPQSMKAMRTAEDRSMQEELDAGEHGNFGMANGSVLNSAPNHALQATHNSGAALAVAGAWARTLGVTSSSFTRPHADRSSESRRLASQC
jgi:hypothetical protein